MSTLTPTTAETTTPIPSVGLNHAVLFVSDIDTAVAFWTAALDLEVVTRIPQAAAAFLRLRNGDNHHDLGLFGLGPGVARPPRPSIGLYHLAWQVPTIDDLAAAKQTLGQLGALVGESSHGATKSLYAADPDGNEFEVMWMLPRDTWGAMAEEATTERLDLDAELARWSGVTTAGR